METARDPMKDKSAAAASMVAGSWNCAQSVLGVFCDELGFDKETAMKLASGFGAGMARRQEVCGAVSGAIMVVGLKHGQAREDDKAAKETAYRLSRVVLDRFQAEFGSCLCRELLPGLDLATEAGHQRYKAEGWSEKICQPCVRFAVRLLEEIL
jgi:C_GCAxxG_C_C family probable redox protein